MTQKNDTNQNASLQVKELEQFDTILDSFMQTKQQDIQSSKSEIEKVQNHIFALDSEIKNLKKIIRPKAKIDSKRLFETSNDNKLTIEEKKINKIRIESYKDQKFYAMECLTILKKEFKALFNAQKESLKLKQLRAKSKSKTYIQRNKTNIYKKFQNTVEELKKKRSKELETLISFAKSEAREDKLKFYASFGQFLNEHNSEVYIVCSGITELKDELFEDARKQISNINYASINNDSNDSRLS